MATISTENIYLKTGDKFKKVVTYSSGMFRIKLPESLCKDLNYTHKEIVADSEQVVNYMFSDELKKWINVIEKNEKVILFRGKFNGALLNKEKWDDWCDGVYKPYSKNGTSHSMSQGIWGFCHSELGGTENGLGLMLKWGVYNKSDINGKLRYEYVSGRDLEIRWDRVDEYTEIPYTEERGTFFLQLDESFANMIAKIYKALGELTPDKLIAISESNTKLLQ